MSKHSVARTRTRRVALATQSGRRVVVDAVVLADTFAVHPSMDDCQSWTLTHIATGLVVAGWLETEKAALECGRRFLDLVPAPRWRGKDRQLLIDSWTPVERDDIRSALAMMTKAEGA